MASLKEKIDLEHPGLKRQRAQSQEVAPEAEGFNLKLGTGGIREIEFFANALQLVWGGKRPQLRVTHTATALRKLAEQHLIAPDLAERFIDHYWWLRRCENRLQLISNQQTHSLPQDNLQRAKFMRLAGIENWSAFATQLFALRTDVRSEFVGLFRSADTDKAQEGTTAGPPWPELAPKVQEIVDMWEQGFRAYGVSPSQGIGLAGLYARLAACILESGLEIEDSIRRIHQYFLRLPPGGQYFRLLQNAPWLVDGLVLPLLYSPAMRILLEQTPHIIDVLLEGDRSPEVRDEFVFHSSDYETRLERMRRLVNEQLYLHYQDFVFGKLSPQELQANLTFLAEHALNMALRVVSEQLAVDRVPIAILGLGKLGMSKMAPLSDLDILYLCAPEQGLEAANRFANRLQTALATPMKEGVVYEMDTRLRPSGRSGPPTISVGSFAAYQFERAKTWEHQALVTARCVAGDRAASDRAMAIRREVLTRSRSPEQWRMDTNRMLMRLREQRIRSPGDDTVATKLRPGGLMETEYLISSAALHYCCDRPEYAELDYVELVCSLAKEIGLPELPDILGFWQTLQLWERLLGLEGTQVEAIPKRFQPPMFAHLGIGSPAELGDKMARCSAKIVAALDELLAISDTEKAELDTWLEQPIEWQTRDNTA